MKLIETYANNLSVEIKDRPTIYEKFFPIPPELGRYITLQNSSGMSAKNYSYWQEVIDILFPILDKEGIRILLIGDKDAAPIVKTVDLRGQTSIHQAAYVINRSLLHMGNDSILGHISCANDINTVLLYGSTTIDNHSPYHHNPAKTIFLESHRNNAKASFARDESPKSIDLINPEDVASAVCKLLSLNMTYEYKTVSIGTSYSNRLIESACTDVIDISKIGVPNIIIRYDYNQNLGVLIQQLSLSKSAIITNKPIPLNILLKYKTNIIEIVVEIDKNHKPEFIKELLDNKIPYRMYSFLPKEELDKIKFQYIDYGIIFAKQRVKPSRLDNYDIEKIYYKSSKITLSGGRIFSSKWAIDNNMPQESFDTKPQKLTNKDIDRLWTDEDYCIFLEKI